MTAPRRSKTAVTYRFPPELIDRLRDFAEDKQWTINMAAQLFIDDGLTRLGYPSASRTTSSDFVLHVEQVL